MRSKAIKCLPETRHSRQFIQLRYERLSWCRMRKDYAIWPRCIIPRSCQASTNSSSPKMMA
jgi:hypothetical protein